MVLQRGMEHDSSLQSGGVEMNGSGRSLKILLIEDDEDDYIFIRDSLADISRKSYSLTWKSSFEDAMDEIGRYYYDACLLDYRLGVHDGLEILRMAGRKNWPVPIVFMTGRGDYDVDVQAMKLGASDYLIKEEINPSLLERSIRYAVEKARAWNALERAYEDLEWRVEKRTEELVELNKALSFSSEQLKMFAYTVAHDLKSPVVAIHGLVRRMMDWNERQLDEKSKLYCHRIMAASRQVIEMSDSINLYIKSRELPLKCERISLQEVFRALEAEYRIPLKERGVQLVFCDENPLILMDRMLVMRALRNLVENALKHGGERLQTITLNYRNDESSHILFVSDDGRGISEGETEGLFNMFSRAGASIASEGMGLGLAIVKEVAERHGGESWIEPAYGRGNKGVSICLSLSKAKWPEPPGATDQD